MMLRVILELLRIITIIFVIGMIMGLIIHSFNLCDFWNNRREYHGRMDRWYGNFSITLCTL